MQEFLGRGLTVPPKGLCICRGKIRSGFYGATPSLVSRTQQYSSIKPSFRADRPGINSVFLSCKGRVIRVLVGTPRTSIPLDLASVESCTKGFF